MNTVLLLQRRVTPGSDEQVVAAARAFADTLPGVPPLQACVSLDGSDLCIYAWSDARLLHRAAAERAALLRLATLREWQGASAGERAQYHYVVATDIDPAKEIEFNSWYHTEHAPALATVPGVVRCARYRCVEGRPSYRAVYNVTSPEVVDSPAWRAARNTPWTARIRPYFVNTTRMLYRTVLDEQESVPLAA